MQHEKYRRVSRAHVTCTCHMSDKKDSPKVKRRLTIGEDHGRASQCKGEGEIEDGLGLHEDEWGGCVCGSG